MLHLFIIRLNFLRLRDVEFPQLRFEIAVHLQLEEGLGNANLELVGLSPAALNYFRVRRQHLKGFRGRHVNLRPHRSRSSTESTIIIGHV